MKIEIKHRWTNEVLHAGDFPNLCAAVADAVSKNINLRGSNLSGCNLRDSDLRCFCRDIEHVLFCHPNEAAAVAQALRDGKVDGSVYSGACACLIGTIANARHCNVEKLERDASRPAECWFTQFKPGRSVANYPPAALTVEWIEEWIVKHGQVAAQKAST